MKLELIDVMGSDQAIEEAARTSYGKGTRKTSETRGLIRYLMRMCHTSPFEQCEMKFLIECSMDTWRQVIRHRTACLAEGTDIYFDLPGGIKRRGNQLYKLKIEDLYRKIKEPNNKIRNMNLRYLNEDNNKIQHTNIVDVFKNGLKPVFRITLSDGKSIEATNCHKFLFDDGWNTFYKKAGLVEVNGKAVFNNENYFIYANGISIEEPTLYQDKEWLNNQYNILKRKIEDIAADCGVSYHTIRKWIRKYSIQHDKGGRSKEPWNKNKKYSLGPRELSEKWIEANKKARGGSASNFWKGGVSKDRQSIGRWTTQVAHKIHKSNNWTCQLCGERDSVLNAHHIIPVWADISLAKDESNLTTLCESCHKKVNHNELDYVDKFGKKLTKKYIKKPRVAWNKMTKAKLVKVEKIEFVGEKETYDIEVSGPHHNFIANGIVTHNSVNEYSTRYSVALDNKTIAGTDWRLQSTTNNQGSEDGYLVWPEEGYELEQALYNTPEEYLAEVEGTFHEVSDDVYQERLKFGVAREQARKDLPLSTYTRAFWKNDLHNILHFLRLRLDSHAQLEIRQIAQEMAKHVKERFPLTWEAFEDYRLNSISLSGPELLALRDNDYSKLSKRELSELQEKKKLIYGETE